MARTIRFHLDEHCDPAIAAGLRLHRVDVTTTTDAELLSAEDEEHLVYARAAGRVIFTQKVRTVGATAPAELHQGAAGFPPPVAAAASFRRLPT
jgi:hypothetical protein